MSAIWKVHQIFTEIRVTGSMVSLMKFRWKLLQVKIFLEKYLLEYFIKSFYCILGKQKTRCNKFKKDLVSQFYEKYNIYTNSRRFNRIFYKKKYVPTWKTGFKGWPRVLVLGNENVCTCVFSLSCPKWSSNHVLANKIAMIKHKSLIFRWLIHAHTSHKHFLCPELTQNNTWPTFEACDLGTSTFL